MGWTAGQLEAPFSSRAAIEFELGEKFANRVIDTARYGTVIYAAVRSEDDAGQVFGLVLLAERRDGLLWTKPISEDMGPAEDACPARILDLLTEPSNDCALKWRERCRARIARGRPKSGQKVAFEHPIGFLDGTEHRVLTFVGGSRFRSEEGALYRIPSWQTRNYQLRTASNRGKPMNLVLPDAEGLVGCTVRSRFTGHTFVVTGIDSKGGYPTVTGGGCWAMLDAVAMIGAPEEGEPR